MVTDNYKPFTAKKSNTKKAVTSLDSSEKEVSSSIKSDKINS